MSEQGFIQGGVVVALVIMFLMPVMVNMFYPEESEEYFNTIAYEKTIKDLTKDYNSFTNAIGSTTEQAWCLTGIYTPYTGGDYNYTADNWIYSTKKTSYTPSQYTWTTPDHPIDTTDSAYTVKLYPEKNNSSVYRYSVPEGETLQDGHKNMDLYTYVTMDIEHQSDIFFTESLKNNMNDKQFWYEYTGYRYAFQPLSDYYAPSDSGTPVKVSAVSTSLSLIWYNFAGVSGISGQLVLTGSDSGVAYITANEIIRAFNSVNNTAKFEMEFNSCEMNVYIRINPYYTTQGYSIEDCYNNGWWSVMVSSITTDTSAYTTPANPLNPEKIWETLLDLFTFNMDDYPMSKTMGLFASLIISLVMYSTLLAIAAHNPKLLIIVAVIALIQTITSLLGGLNIEDLFSGWPPW